MDSPLDLDICGLKISVRIYMSLATICIGELFIVICVETVTLLG